MNTLLFITQITKKKKKKKRKKERKKERRRKGRRRRKSIYKRQADFRRKLCVLAI
jgi:hypothetical protein